MSAVVNDACKYCGAPVPRFPEKQQASVVIRATGGSVVQNVRIGVPEESVRRLPAPAPDYQRLREERDALNRELTRRISAMTYRDNGYVFAPLPPAAPASRWVRLRWALSSRLERLAAWVAP